MKNWRLETREKRSRVVGRGPAEVVGGNCAGAGRCVEEESTEDEDIVLDLYFLKSTGLNTTDDSCAISYVFINSAGAASISTSRGSMGFFIVAAVEKQSSGKLTVHSRCMAFCSKIDNAKLKEQ